MAVQLKSFTISKCASIKSEIASNLPRSTAHKLVARNVRRQRPGKLNVTSHLKTAYELVEKEQIRRVKPKEAQAVIEEGYKVLDIRPDWEYANASVDGSVHVPFFVEDEGMDPITLLKKSINMGYGGLWQGSRLTKENVNFLPAVADGVAKEEKVLLTCAEGLRSLLAVEVLHGQGYTELAWLDGGYQSCSEEDLPNQSGECELRFASIGGVSQYFLKLATYITEMQDKKEEK
ncbi:hypothetical protein CYMTET_56071 [Cymbomonas tetramitiformis]|uniref:Rhodanese domain-containing protein n=1 Tax=Cymbomonas tetramitiformis TaxID=36881 RepID=A0AAE0BDE5_9CHLO|nr:hypothetical protein CYMTET_56071 [Cymbomonas tetramitiformis]